MLRWTLLTLAVSLLALGALTLAKSPTWSPWQLGVLAGEYGHWFAAAAVLVAGLSWALRGGSGETLLAGATAGVAVLAGSSRHSPSSGFWGA